MGIQDRDYWRERYDQNLSARRDPGDSPFSSARNEMGFMGKLIVTAIVLFIGVIAYRYHFEIIRFIKGFPPTAIHQQAPQPSVLKPTEPATAVAPKPATSDFPKPEASGQIYRCGNTYSNSPCEGGRQIAQQSTPRVDTPTTREIYLCKDIHDRLTWESVPCSVNGRFIDRIARVPANIPWESQVALARQQRDKAYAIAAEQVVPVATRPSSSVPGECRILEERIRVLDAECRVKACGMDQLDYVRAERKKTRDRQFRIGC